MYRDSIVLTLGHNSSAVLIRENRIVCGYETERLTGVKSDSTFPRAACEEIFKHHDRSMIGPIDVYVSHWDLHGSALNMKAKHWDPSYIAAMCSGGAMFETTQYFTHHDAHAYSAVIFAGKDFPQKPEDKTYLFVMDGFGTLGEHMSFYRLVDGIPVLLERKYGFGSSLGLLYQYATAFMGMKQNQDEYKLLAFEAGIAVLGDGAMMALDSLIEEYSDLYRKKVASYMTADDKDPMLDLGALPNTAKEVADMLSVVCTRTRSETDRQRRIACSYFVQAIVESVVTMFVEAYSPNNVLLVGGLFYNVKLNNLISSKVPGKTCIMPLAGDQGAGLGVYKSINPDFELPDHLFWGERDLRPLDGSSSSGILYYTDRGRAYEEIAYRIEQEGFVNVVDGAMEFGPRALCHTTTFGLPDPEVAGRINRCNSRVNEMPFAPVMTEAQADERLEGCDRIHKSLDYMICTRDYRPGMMNDMMGAAHRYPRQERWSARPQIARDPNVIGLLTEFGPLINTSFNYHGVPIVCTAEQVKHSHAMERSVMGEDWPTTIVIDER